MAFANFFRVDFHESEGLLLNPLVYKVNTENSEIPTNKDFESRWETASMEIPVLIDVWEEGSHEVPKMCWMEWFSGQHYFIFGLSIVTPFP